ncbi:bifunctional proline dehydrogenase/L-glutamate gamma-semialdehyde dehydrogenase PutA [Thaumasiovibrio sp. DFM-14]|uniref:bifunctional proline dehydrogenase/L-glutamate gamma-semialdehyde dehydrogenase PutA n=1 Tax=Thaumasiovibrio sp. DFM-14 TaxID=3384792 RepID=UPI0039A25AC1
MIKAADYFKGKWQNQSVNSLWANISPLYMVDETEWILQLIPYARKDDQEVILIEEQSTTLIRRIRTDKRAIGMIDALLMEYSLDSDEGVLLMCIAEALMRIPDKRTAASFLRDKFSVADWQAHLQGGDSVFVNLSTWGLLLTGKVIELSGQPSPDGFLARLMARYTEPVVCQLMQKVMRVMAYQFVLGQSIEEAMTKGAKEYKHAYRLSFDMLGEAALTQHDALTYFRRYSHAISEVSRQYPHGDERPSVSIKLSALYPRYEASNYHNVMQNMYTQLLTLLQQARACDVMITIDAEESDRLEISLQLFEKLRRSDELLGWSGLGIVVQAYAKRALAVLGWLAKLAQDTQTRIPIRLVKGAYWDSEIKHCQQLGLTGYPVYTRKEATDVAYLACARFLLCSTVNAWLYPQFASHNAHTITAVAAFAKKSADFEFQRLYGMGEALYRHAIQSFQRPVRIYAPVGNHQDLLPYLVRRLLENGANSSFVHRLVDIRYAIDSLVTHPVDALLTHHTLPHPAIPLPQDIFQPERINSRGINLQVHSEYVQLQLQVEKYTPPYWQASNLINGDSRQGDKQIVQTAPFCRSVVVGQATLADPEIVQEAFNVAKSGVEHWSITSVAQRAEWLEAFALSLEEHRAELIALCQWEAGKTWQDCVDEIREAVDFCRYYAQQARALFEQQAWIGSDGLPINARHQAKGVILCISPWNFPLAIFVGQVCAALVVGNSVVAKPAPQTSLIAHRCVELMFAAGLPVDTLQLVLGGGDIFGNALIQSPHLSGVVFTGSVPTAKLIQKQLAQRAFPVMFIAETGGLNAMLVDSTALPEQVVRDVIRSAFASAGQRCSALRVLYVQQEIAPQIIALIKGAISELQVGDPCQLATDVGPVIDAAAKQRLLDHLSEFSEQILFQYDLHSNCAEGSFVAPTLVQLQHMAQLKHEPFGPVLHIITYDAAEIDTVISAINQSGYGLTLGLHSRNTQTYEDLEQKIKVGNSYINRDQVGAVVGVQPFGGLGLSGTGPKAGGPYYLTSFVNFVLEEDNAG